MTAELIYKELRKNLSQSEIALNLNLHQGTLKRWEQTQKVPQNYIHDLNALLGYKYKLKKSDFKSFDEYFTKKEIALYCFESFMKFLSLHKIDSKNYHFIEPSCGNLSFYNLMPKNARLGIDLAFKNDEILQQNFLDFSPDLNLKYIVLGNPPFGLRGNLALRFINHAAKFADFIAFILPPLFDSDGKGSPKKRVQNLELVHSEKLPLKSFIYPNKKEVEVATLFQIWAHKRLLENNILHIQKNAKKTCKDFIKIYSLSDGGTSSSTRNKHMLYSCDLYLPSTCFHSKTSKQMKSYEHFEDLPHRRGYGVVILQDKKRVKEALQSIDWVKTSFLGTNSSLNLRSSLIEEALIQKGFYDKNLLLD